MCHLNRRQFGASSLAAAAALTLRPWNSVSAATSPTPRDYCAFIKFLTDLPYERLAESIAALGFGGVEVTVRANDGYIQPAQAAAELPKFRQALEKHGLEITIVTTDIVAANHPHAESVLRAAADNGAKRYRLGFIHYDDRRRVVEQLEELRSDFDKIAALNRRIGVTGMYQNHAGAGYFGATLWDLYYVLRNYQPMELGCVYDLRHATVEAGESWSTLHQVIEPHIVAYSAKDFDWGDRGSVHTPLGTGRVDPQFYSTLAKSGFDGPISLHVEYLEQSDPDAQLAALKRDFATLRQWMDG